MNGRFRDRIEAGKALAKALGPRDGGETVVLALPRGGLPVGWEVARAIGAPLDVVLVRKIGAPGQPELAVGAVVDGDEPVYVVNDDIARALRLTGEEVRAMAGPQLAEIERRRELYRGGRTPVPVEGKTVIIVDDGIATGATARAAIEAVRRRGAARIVLAVPAAPPGSLSEVAMDADEAIAVRQPSPFLSVGGCYERFEQIDDAEVVALLARSAEETGGGKSQE